MTIDLTPIVKTIDSTRTVRVELEMEAFSHQRGDTFPIVEKNPFELTLSNHEDRELVVAGETEIVVQLPCDRCLTEVRTPIHLSIDKHLKLQGEELVDEDMEETDYLIGFELDVERLAYTEILVNWPMKVLCRSGCRGICRICGKNLNEGDCGCQRTELDPRMAAIQDVFNKCKEV